MTRRRSEKAPDPGRSRERAEQDRLLAREARKESWLTRLWRQRWLDKGRPDPGNRAGDDLDRRNR